MRLAIFDVDGTLIDSQHLLVRSMTHAFQSEGLQPPPRRAVLDLVGVPLHQTIAILSGREDPDLQERLLDAYREAYFGGHGAAAMPLFDGMIDVLDRLEADGWLLAVATGKGRRGLIAALDLHGLGNRFLAMRTADDGPGKPDPSAVGDVCDALGVPPHQSVMIGDTTFDMTAGSGAGCRCIGVTWGYHAVDLLEGSGADTIVDRVDGLPGAAERLVPKDVAA